MSDAFDRDASEIIDFCQRVVGKDAQGQLLVYVASKLRVVHLQGMRAGCEKAHDEVAKAFNKKRTTQ